MPLAFTPACPFGKRLIVAGGTPQLLFSTTEVPVAAAGVWPARVSRIYIEALNSNAGFIYIGVKGMVVSTMVGVIASIAAPAAGPAVFYYDFPQVVPGDNRYRLQDYWIDGSTGEGVIRTVFVS